MDLKVLHAEVRTDLGKAGTKKVRKLGKIPAVVYGHGEPVSLSIDDREFHKNFKHISESTIIDLQINNKSHQVLIKDFQDEILTGKITHIDFYELEKGKALRTHVPLHFTGTPVGVKEGGQLEIVLHETEIECLPKDLPESLSMDVTALKIGSCLYVKDLAASNKAVKFLGAPEQVIVHVVHTKENVVVTEEAAAAPAAE